MKYSHLHSNSNIFAMLVIGIAICFPVECQETRPYDTCGQSVRCGDIDFKYPFWGLSRPQYCGHPGFQLTCPSDVPILLSDSVNYRVLQDPDTSTHMITIARNDLWSTICPQYLYNTSFDSTLFDGNNLDQDHVSLFYGCENIVPGGILLADSNIQFPCVVNSTNQTDSYFFLNLSVDASSFFKECHGSITVPVDRSSADRLELATASGRDLNGAFRAGFKLRWMAKNDECDQCVRSDGLCGSNATSPELFACYCANGSFSLTCNNSNEGGGGGSSGTKRKLIIAILCSVAGIMLFLFVIIYRKTRISEGPRAANDQLEIFIRNYGILAPKRYKYSEIKKMTNSFQEKLGQGGYGSVYKGQLPDGQLVAVKLLRKATGIGEDFINEVASISRTSHVNVVTLIGFCFEGKKRALLYEFMPNGSLEKFIRSDGFQLDWNTLFQIAKGIARGLEYLHRGCNTRIVHFDIKPHNILLDEEFVPKLSDFGLAKLCKKKESIVSITGARGTAGYIAPEVIFKSLGGASHKSDVYSYGMMVLEMTGARKHNNARRTSTSEECFPDWIYKQLEVGGNLGDNGVTTEEEDELARKMMTVSLWCIQSDPSDRPSISKVVEMLEGSFKSLQVPPRRFESSPGRPSSMKSSSGERVSTVHSLPNSREVVH